VIDPVSALARDAATKMAANTVSCSFFIYFFVNLICFLFSAGPPGEIPDTLQK
jgi:hypothetical protein